MFKVFGRNNCSYCKQAIGTLEFMGWDYKYYNIEEDKEAMKEFRSYFPFAKTVPQIVKMTPNDGDHEFLIIGGMSNLADYIGGD